MSKAIITYFPLLFTDVSEIILTSSSFPREGRHVIEDKLSVARFTSSLRRPDPASYPAGTGVLYPGDKAAGV
jgi:hypothetical protein